MTQFGHIAQRRMDFGDPGLRLGAQAGITRIADFPISLHASACLRALEFGNELSRGNCDG
jgi:hypothetical protein